MKTVLILIHKSAHGYFAVKAHCLSSGESVTLCCWGTIGEAFQSAYGYRSAIKQ